MAGMLRRSAAWLGLVADDRYADDRYDPVSSEVTEEVYQEESEHIAEIHTFQTTYVPPQEEDLSRIITVSPRAYNDARTIGEHFREGIPVIMNLVDMDEADAKRLVDFSAGLTFGLHGTIERVTTKVFLLSPSNVKVTAEDKDRIAGGFFNQS